MEMFSFLIGGLGIGTLLSNVLNYFLNKKAEKAEKLYKEKREAYIGMAKALYDVEIDPGPKNAKLFGYNLNLAKIFGNKEIVLAGQKVIDTKPNSPERWKALEELFEAMAKDLRKN